MRREPLLFIALETDDDRLQGPTLTTMNRHNLPGPRSGEEHGRIALVGEKGLPESNSVADSNQKLRPQAFVVPGDQGYPADHLGVVDTLLRPTGDRYVEPSPNPYPHARAPSLAQTTDDGTLNSRRKICGTPLAVRSAESWYGSPMRWVACICILAALGSCQEEVYFIPGTGSLPDCDEAPVTNLDAALLFDQGTVTIRSLGCQQTMPDDTFASCALNWAFTQTGNDVDIIVDEEYRLEGRICGDQLYLRGGWWLPVVDEDLGYCTYDDDSADEVGIMAEGNVLEVSPSGPSLTGTLVVQGSCSASYQVTFAPVRDPSL